MSFRFPRPAITEAQAVTRFAPALTQLAQAIAVDAMRQSG